MRRDIRYVWGRGGAVGFTRDGTHAERILVPIAALSRTPKNLGFIQAASVGVNLLVAWQDLVEATAVQPGETVLIIGAAIGVGGSVAQIAHHHGSRVIGADRSALPRDAAIHHIADTMLIGAEDLRAPCGKRRKAAARRCSRPRFPAWR